MPQSMSSETGGQDALRNPLWEDSSEVIHLPSKSHKTEESRKDYSVPWNIITFTPSLSGSHDIYAYLQDVDFHVQMLVNVSTQENIYLLRITSSKA